jgi:hypothetical protein
MNKNRVNREIKDIAWRVLLLKFKYEYEVLNKSKETSIKNSMEYIKKGFFKSADFEKLEKGLRFINDTK